MPRRILEKEVHQVPTLRVRIDRARIATISSDPADLAAAVAAIARRHPQYLTAPPPGPAITITVHRWTGWAAGSA
jgi:hypothetical protein